nr:glycosyltransferase family 4 protein [candidate division Zixibacteria bacterium]
MKNGKNVILHLRGSEFYGSPERLIVGQVVSLDDFEFVCATYLKPGQSSEYLEELRKRNITCAEITGERPLDLNIPRQIRDIIGDYGVDLVVTHEYKSNFYGYLALRKLPVPQVAHFHGWTQEGPRVKLYNWLDRRILPRVDAVITVSHATAGLLRKAGVGSDKIEVVYNAVEFDDSYIPPIRTRGNRVKIGYIGRLSYEKGLHVLLTALRDLKNLPIPFVLEIYGSGPEKSTLKAMVEEFGLSDQVVFMGFRKDIDEVYKTLDFLVLPSLSEGHPVTILEAWKHGLGIIASRAGGIPEVVENGKEGILVDVGDTTSLSGAITKGLEDSNLMDLYGSNGLERLKREFTFKAHTGKISALYKRLLEQS